MSDTLTQPAASTYTSGSKAQVQGPSVDPLLFRVPMFASSSNPDEDREGSIFDTGPIRRPKPRPRPRPEG
uniref:Uncharacterized protein n=1 Tax=Magallana gigas TaxID=29159 RepID=K1RFY0_MAGGI